MRARNIKPGFFKNEDLADCDLQARLLFVGLWCMADKEGRLEYRPKRIKAELFPYDACNIQKLIDQLASKHFIFIYSVNENTYIQIINFVKHQNPHIKEQESTIQAPCLNGVDLGISGLSTSQAAPLTESPILIPESPILKEDYSKEFLEFWSLYPNKVEKQYTYKCWKKLKLKPNIDILRHAIQLQLNWRVEANGEFRPEWKNPATWLNKGCWDDELKESEGNIDSWVKSKQQKEVESGNKGTW